MSAPAEVALTILVLAASCASIRDMETHPHPSVGNSVAGCFISCPEGWLNERMHECRGGRQWTQDIRITGEDEVPGNPSESRWLTGMPSFGADVAVRERLAARGIKEIVYVERDGVPVKESNPLWTPAYIAEMKRVQREMGDEAREAYLKSEVVLMNCESYRQSRCFAKAATSSPCAAHPGEPDPLHPHPFP